MCHLASGHRFYTIGLYICNPLCGTDLHGNLHLFRAYYFCIAMQVLFQYIQMSVAPLINSIKLHFGIHLAKAELFNLLVVHIKEVEYL